MKMFRPFLLAAAVVLPLSLTAQDISFDIEYTSPKKPEVMTIKVATSGSRTMIQPMTGASSGVRIIADNASRSQYLLMENNGQKMAMQVDAFDQAAAAANTKTKAPVIKQTNETKVIDGMKCTKVTAETEEAVSTLWVTKEAGITYQDLYRIVNTSKGTPGSFNFMPQVNSMEGFPLQISTQMKDKDQPVVMNIKRISRAKVDAKLFSMDGYKVTDMRKMK